MRLSAFIAGIVFVAVTALAMPPPAVAAIAFVQVASSTPGGTATTVTKAFPNAQVAGDTNVVFIAWEDSTTLVSSISDTKGNTYTLGNKVTSSGLATQAVYYAKNIAAAAANANTVTVTLNATVTNPDLRIVEYSGLDPASPFDVAVGSSGSGTLPTSGSATTTNANDVLVGSNFTAHAITGPGTGYTQRLIDGDIQIVEDRIVTSTGSYSATSPQSPGGWYVMQMIALAAASSTTPPYAQSSILNGITWDQATKQRYASGSDIWDSAWASDGLIYSAWGDGAGFTGGATKWQIGVSKLTGTPASGPLTGTDVYHGTTNPQPPPTCVQKTTLGGKPRGVVALPSSVIYMFHSTQDLCTSTSWLAKSADNGSTWTDHVSSLVWPDANGFGPASFLQYGSAQAGGLISESGTTQYLYIYANKTGVSGTTYLARVASSPANSIETLANWSYYSGTDASGNPTWAASSASAAPIWTDSNHAESSGVTFNPGVGRYILYNDHGTACSGAPCERQVGLFDAPSPWGPWTTFDYEENFDNTGCGTNCLGNQEAVGFSMMQKWFGSDGLTIWPAYSSIGNYDSLNLIKGTISLASGSVVTGLSLSTGKPAVLSKLSVSDPGNLEYIDRTYRLTAIPSPYVGKEQIRLPNNDKAISVTNYVNFTLTSAQNVCVAWDSANTAAAWLSTWTNTGNSLTGNATFNVYQKAFSAGPVSIPGASSNDVYILFVGC